MKKSHARITFAWFFRNVDQRWSPRGCLGGTSGMYLRTVRGETRIFSFTNSSLAIRSSPHSGFSCAIPRINARNSAGIGGRPALHLPRQKSRHPSRCQRIMVAGRTRTTASRQTNSLVNSARLMRVNASTLRGLTPRSKYLASCRRRTRFSVRIALDERKNDNPSLKMSENNPIAICANLNSDHLAKFQSIPQPPTSLIRMARIIAEYNCWLNLVCQMQFFGRRFLCARAERRQSLDRPSGLLLC